MKASKKTMRITGGKLVRRLFDIPKLVDEGVVRPTPDRVRESLFAMLSPYLLNAHVLDLFAGSGAHGFESISRGASQVTFVEKNLEIKKTIEGNIKKLNLDGLCKILLNDVLSFINKNPIDLYDIIFVDPPYSLLLDEDFFKKLNDWLKPDGLVIYRSFKKAPITFGDNWQIARDKVYGGTKIYLLRKKVHEAKTQQ